LKFKKIALGALAALVVAGSAVWFTLDKETRGLLAALPTNRDLLFWSEPQRDAAFRALDRLPVLAKVRVVPAGGTPLPLPLGPPLKLALDVDAYMAGQRSAALLVLHDGKVRLERYGLDFDSGGRWTSFSVAKSITSTLVGAAIRDGHIRSMDDKVSEYIPQMKGSAYDDVSIRQLLTMTSGVRWNEDYADPNSDVARFNSHEPEEGVDALVSYLRRLPREVPPGTRWHCAPTVKSSALAKWPCPWPTTRFRIRCNGVAVAMRCMAMGWLGRASISISASARARTRRAR